MNAKQIEYLSMMVFATCLQKSIDHNPLHVDLQKVALQIKRPNLLQNIQIIYMEKEHVMVCSNSNVLEKGWQN